MITPIALRPMHQRPPKGQRITVLMLDGQQIECNTTLVVSGDKRGIVIYHKRNAIDESKAKGWWMSPQRIER